MGEYNKHQAGGRYQVRLSSDSAEIIQPSTKAGSRSAKTFMGIVDAKQIARAITRI